MDRIVVYLDELGITDVSQPLLLLESVCARRLVNASATMRKAKNIENCYHFVQSPASSKAIGLDNISSQDKITDMFTKPLDKILCNRFRDLPRILKSGAHSQEECWVVLRLTIVVLLRYTLQIFR